MNGVLDSIVAVRRTTSPIIPTSRWRDVGGRMIKSYKFIDVEGRNDFIGRLIAYESKTMHFSRMVIDGLVVEIDVMTPGIDTVTELDREYAAFADSLHRETLYCSGHGR